MWDGILEGRIILLGDFNVHSPEWNIHYGERRDTSGFEALMERNDLILNNEPGMTTRLTQRNTTPIIDLTFTTLVITALEVWIINDELSTLSDH